MAALNGGLGATGLTNGTAGTMDALTQAYSGIQQYAAAALPTLYSQSLLQQQSAAGSQKEGTCGAARGACSEELVGASSVRGSSSLSTIGVFFFFKKPDKGYTICFNLLLGSVFFSFYLLI